MPMYSTPFVWRWYGDDINEDASSYTTYITTIDGGITSFVGQANSVSFSLNNGDDSVRELVILLKSSITIRCSVYAADEKNFFKEFYPLMLHLTQRNYDYVAKNDLRDLHRDPPARVPRTESKDTDTEEPPMSFCQPPERLGPIPGSAANRLTRDLVPPHDSVTSASAE